MKTDVRKLVALGPIQTGRLCKDVVWGSIYIGHYENRYGIDPHVVYDFCEGYLEWLKEDFDLHDADMGTLWEVFDREFKNGDHSFYTYTHYMYEIPD